MAKVSFLLIPPELETLYKKALCAGDRFTFSRVRVNKLFYTRDRKKGISTRSILPEVSLLWSSLSPSEKLAWNSAGASCSLTGWKLFVRDVSYRRKNDMIGVSTPSDLYQVEVGLLHLEGEATSLRISQIHPLSYYIYKKKTGTRSQYDPVHMIESFALPLTLSVSVRSALTSAGASPRARVWVDILSNYQGRDIHTLGELSFDLIEDWNRKSVTISSVLGVVRGYTAYIEVVDAQGDFFFDNFSLFHSGFDFARDPSCNDIDQSFTKQYAQIPKHWASEEVIHGAFFGSVYYNKYISI